MWRKLQVILRNLPNGARLYRAMDLANGWSDETHMAAYLIDLLAAANWQRAGGKGRKPRPVRHPGMAEVKNQTVYGDKPIARTQEEIHAYLKSIGPRREPIAEEVAHV